MNKKILVTGGAGYIGSHTVRFLINKGINPSEIVIFDSLERGNKETIPKEVNFVKGDLKDFDSISSVFEKFEIDSVIHFAAYAYVGESVENPFLYFKNNFYAGLNLLESMVKFGVKKIIFSSTCATFGIPEKTPITESFPQIPINPYGESKLMFEKALKWYDEIYGIKSVILRYFNAAGADFEIGEMHFPETHLIPIAIQALLKKRDKLIIYGNDYQTYNGTCIRDYIHVFDLANAHYLALKYLEETNKSNDFNLGTGEGTSIIEIISLLEQLTDLKLPFEIQEKRKGDPPILIADSKKAREILKWEPQKTIKDVLLDSYNWEKNRE
jgi:UDP-glucose 4-epimerase